MQVALVRSEDRFLLNPAAHDRKERVREGYADNDQRSNKGYNRNLLKSEHRQHRQAEAQEQRACITHEDLCRMKVKEQESENRSKEQETYQRYRQVAHQERHHEDRADRDAGYAGGQTVQPIDQVDGVRHADNPEDGERNRNPVLQRRIRIIKRYIYKINFDVKSEYDDGCSDDLTQQLHLGRQFETVIQSAGQDDQRAANQKGFNKVRIPNGKMIRDKW